MLALFRSAAPNMSQAIATPAQYENAVFLTCDNKYLPYALFLASEIAKAWPQRNFDICLVHEGEIADHKLIHTHGIRLIPFDKQDKLEGPEIDGHRSAVWNWPTCLHTVSFSHFVDPCFGHFIGKHKPWHDLNGVHAKEDVNAYRSFIATHFPELLATYHQPDPHNSKPWKWPFMFLRQAKDYFRIRPYLKRISDDDFDMK